ncbi:MAG: copper ion binding protein [Thermaerobacter sp.]|nr:copper ion binding protein [Thermaerobacter sp.]
MASQITLNIEGMTCNHCRMAVERALGGLPGVASARVDLEHKSAQVSYDADRVTLEDMRRAVAQAGYRVA